jgi:hypothetical protein
MGFKVRVRHRRARHGTNRAVDFLELFEQERSRYEDGAARLDPGQLVRIGNAAYGAGLALLMLGRRDEAFEWLLCAAERWRESWEHAAPASWGRPIGAVKAAVIAGGGSAEGYAVWALELGSAEADSPIGRYAATLALLVLGRWGQAEELAATLRGRDDFPREVGDALAGIAGGDGGHAAIAIAAVLESFESREDYLEGVPVADTVLVLQALAGRRGLTLGRRASVVLPGG